MPDPWLRRDWIAPGMELIAQGGRTGQLYVLREGELEVLRDGRHITTIKTPGSVIGEMSVLLGAPQTATVRAVTAVDPMRWIIEQFRDVLYHGQVDDPIAPLLTLVACGLLFVAALAAFSRLAVDLAKEV